MSAPSLRIAARGIAGLVLVTLLVAACSSAATPVPPTAAPATAPPAATTSPAATSGGGGYGNGGGSPAASSPAPSSGGSTGVVVNMATTSLGPVLVGPNGLTLYTHSGDTATSSTCIGGCATAWPPLTVAAGAKATAGQGVAGTLGTLTRADGTIQVTYNGMPLYGWQKDAKPGDVTGQGIGGFTVAKP